MKRRLFFLERILYGDGTQPFNGVFAVSVKGVLENGRMINALERIQQKYALLRARVELDEKGMPWFVVHRETPPIPLRVIERRGSADWIEESKRQWAEAFEAWRGPLLRVVWLKGEAVSDLMLVFHHCLCDGGSALALMQDLLLLLDEPEAEIGDADSLVTASELLPDGRGWKERKARGVAALIRAALSAGALLTSSRGKSLIPRSEDYLLHWKLDGELSAALFRYCKSVRVTVNTLLCVTALQAFWEIRGNRSYQKVTCPVDIRRYHTGIRKDMLFSFGMAVSLSLKRKRRDSFGGLVQEAQRMMSKRLDRLDADEFLLTMESSHGALADMIKVLTYGKPGNDLMFSNMGRLEIRESYSSFVVETAYSPTVIGPFGNPTTLVTTTYQGLLDFCLISNRTVLSEEEARAIRDKMISILNYTVCVFFQER